MFCACHQRSQNLTFRTLMNTDLAFLENGKLDYDTSLCARQNLL